MTPNNPYAAPQASTLAQSPGAVQGFADYVPLGWRTALAAISVFGMTFLDAGMRFGQLALGDTRVGSVSGGSPDLAAAAIVGVTALGVLALSVCSWIFVPVWIYRAAANLRGLGRYGMTFTPGGCVGWFFVPIANLWKPPQAMSEIWRASDPQAEQGSWFASSGTPLIGVWWASWVISGVVSWGSILARDSPSSAASIGLASCAFRAIAALALVLIMRGVSSRQEQAAARPGRSG
jgi:hypothetical protein